MRGKLYTSRKPIHPDYPIQKFRIISMKGIMVRYYDIKYDRRMTVCDFAGSFMMAFKEIENAR